jgi:hypothetical protein
MQGRRTVASGLRLAPARPAQSDRQDLLLMSSTRFKVQNLQRDYSISTEVFPDGRFMY